MSLVGTEFAYSHMSGLGWSRGKGLGKNNQGIVDAIKPKFKFDQTGVGHNRAEEFEFHWWDHVFNKAAKNIIVDEDNSGEVKVEMNLDKSDLSTKKMRKKARKEMRNKLYSNFVRSGTLTGGKMTEEEPEEEMEVTKDLSKIKELSDDQLVAACAGLTAHKGARHGLNMKAKLDRIAEAEREFMAKYGGAGDGDRKPESGSKKSKKKRSAEVVSEEEMHSEKKSKKEDVDSSESRSIEESLSKKSKKKREAEPVLQEEMHSEKKSKKKNKKSDREVEEVSANNEKVKTKKKKKKDKLKDNPE